jgi:putative transposase
VNRKITFAVGEYYHLYNRGVDKREIFLDDSDRKRFMRLLFIANGTKPFEYRNMKDKSFLEIERDEPLVAIGAFCLMPNHFHLLVKETVDSGLSDFMEKLTTGYSKYFNTKYKRTGTLFQGVFQAQHVDRDEYLKYLYAYIHLNPIKLIDSKWKETGIQDKKKAQKYLASYPHSSFIDYARGDEVQREEAQILSKKEFPEYFSDQRDFSDLVNDWLLFQEEKE